MWQSSHLSLRDPRTFCLTLLRLFCMFQVILAFLSSVTMLYLIFPFFTYVESSGLLGARLPQVGFSDAALPEQTAQPIIRQSCHHNTDHHS